MAFGGRRRRVGGGITNRSDVEDTLKRLRKARPTAYQISSRSDKRATTPTRRVLNRLEVNPEHSILCEGRYSTRARGDKVVTARLPHRTAKDVASARAKVLTARKEPYNKSMDESEVDFSEVGRALYRLHDGKKSKYLPKAYVATRTGESEVDKLMRFSRCVSLCCSPKNGFALLIVFGSSLLQPLVLKTRSKKN